MIARFLKQAETAFSKNTNGKSHRSQEIIVFVV